MASLIGMFLGAIVAVYLVSIIFRWALRRLVRFEGASEERITYLAVALAAGVSFFLYGYGSADGGPPDYTWAWIYILAGVPVLLILRARLSKPSETESQG